MKFSKLRGLIKAKGMTEAELAQKINLSASSLSCRLSGKVEWTLPEIRMVCCVLEIPSAEMGDYFFV